jgi:ABC-type Fe3+-siderophore transport system permease subunit
MLFINILEVLLILVGPIVGYSAAMRRKSKRWKVILWSGVGGALAAALLIAFLFLDDMTDSSTQTMRMSAMFVGSYMLFGLVLGIIGLVTRVQRRRRLLLYGVAMVGLIGAVRVAISAVHRPSDYGASGVVFDPAHQARNK